MEQSPGKKFRDALASEQPLQIVGTINAYCSLMAEKAGFKAIYLSGAGVANMSYGLPDLGFTSLENVLADATRITSVSSLPLLVDVDTGWEEGDGIAHTITQMIAAKVAAVHIEDQISAKRCGHRPHKRLVSCEAMVERLTAAVAARSDPHFYLIARTDALANEGLSAAIERAAAYIEAGADAIFAEAMTDLSQYQQFCCAINAPILANITEFGRTPLYTLSELQGVGVAMALYPLSATRAMNQAAMTVYQTLRHEGSQKTVLPLMQDRQTLYEILHYEEYEQRSD